MIEQRNLSLISNRTAEGGGRRIPEAVIERDYCLSWLLMALSHFPLKNALAFKGGTALRRCYFKDYRFSEDLDFTLLESIPLQQILEQLKPVFTYVMDESGISFEVNGEEPSTENTHTFYLTYIGPLPGKGKNVKVDVTYREKIVHPLQEKAMIKTYPEYSDFEADAKIKVYSLEEVATEKVCALLSPARTEPRDLYDIWYLVEEEDLKLAPLVSAIEEKLRFKGGPLERQKDQLDKKAERLRLLWSNRLANQMSVLPGFEEVYRSVKRALRQVIPQ